MDGDSRCAAYGCNFFDVATFGGRDEHRNQFAGSKCAPKVQTLLRAFDRNRLCRWKSRLPHAGGRNAEEKSKRREGADKASAREHPQNGSLSNSSIRAFYRAHGLRRAKLLSETGFFGTDDAYFRGEASTNMFDVIDHLPRVAKCRPTAGFRSITFKQASATPLATLPPIHYFDRVAVAARSGDDESVIRAPARLRICPPDTRAAFATTE